MSGIILNHYSTLFTEAWSLGQTQSLYQNPPVCSGNSASLTSKTGITDSRHVHLTFMRAPRLQTTTLMPFPARALTTKPPLQSNNNCFKCFLKTLCVCARARACACMCTITCVPYNDCGGQRTILDIGFLLPPCWFWGPNSGHHQVWQQCLYPLNHLASSYIYIWHVVTSYKTCPFSVGLVFNPGPSP